MINGADSQIQIREIDPNSKDEIELVAKRMRQTLVEVLGEEKGISLYSMDWLRDRVRWHLDPKQTIAKIFLIQAADGEIKGHAIVRLDRAEDRSQFGYFSTIFVEPNSRGKRFASALIDHVERWLCGFRAPKLVYNTAKNHFKLIRLFEHHGFQITARESEMVQLTKIL